MNQLWKHLKRWGLPLVARIGLAMPLLLGLGAALMLVAIWWLGPQWVWREQQPLASVAHRGLASLALSSVRNRWQVHQPRSRTRQKHHPPPRPGCGNTCWAGWYVTEAREH